MAVGKQKPSTSSDDAKSLKVRWHPDKDYTTWEPFSVAPLDQHNPHLRDDPDPHGSATILAVIISIGLVFMFAFGLWVGKQWLG